MSVGERLTRLIGIVYRRVFKQEMSLAEGDFVRGLSWVGAGSLLASGLLAVFSIAGGRILGPEEYGRFSLVESIAVFLGIPMLMGFDIAMLKYNAERDDLARQKAIISTAHIIIAGLTAVSVIIMLLLARPLAAWFAATPELFRFSLWFAVLYAFVSLAQTTLRSIGRMRAFALSQAIRAAILLAAFSLFVLVVRLTLESMLYSWLIACAATGLGIYFLYTRRYVTRGFDSAWARTLTRFAFAYLGAGISFVAYGHIGKIIVAHYLTVADVGVYGAYYTATMRVAVVLWGVFNMVFLPTASRYKDKRPLLRRLNRLVPLVIAFGIPLIMGAGYVILLLYGHEYPLNPLWLALFSTAAILFIIRGLSASLLTSEGPRGAFLTSVAAVTTALVSLGLSILLVPVMDITGAVVAISAAYLCGIVALIVGGRKSLDPQ